MLGAAVVLWEPKIALRKRQDSHNPPGTEDRGLSLDPTDILEMWSDAPRWYKDGMIREARRNAFNLNLPAEHRLFWWAIAVGLR